MLKTIKLTDEGMLSENNFNTLVKDLENKLADYYDLGDDKFKIDHGDNYFAFFHRLGKLKYYVVIDIYSNRVAGIGCCILRKINDEKIWNICDLKVDKEYRNKNIPLQLFTFGLTNSFLSQKAYMICMENAKEQIWHIINKCKKKLPSYLSYLVPKKGPELLIYSLNAKEMTVAHKLLSETYDKISYLSLAGIKDLIMKSTEKALELYHVQYGPNAGHTDIVEPIITGTHMFCCQIDSNLVALLAKENIVTVAKAQVFHFGMEKNNFDFVLTSDI